ncbi:MAG: hypothetical protein V7603_4282 [Micromonosporaceae bacterium]
MAGAGAPAPDETARMDPVTDDTAPMDPVGDDTAPMEPVGLGDTAPMEPVADETAPMEPVRDGGPDATVPVPRTLDQTAPMPPVPDEAPRWAGRAGVTPPTTRPVPAVEPDWPAAGPGQSRTWWLPILVGIAALALVGLILLGIWLALRGQNAPVVSSSPTVAPSSAAAPSPSPSPPPSASPSAATVLLPTLRGLTLGDAEQALTSMGLTYTVQNRVDGSLPPGTVSGTQPDANSQVPAGSQVILFVTTAAPSSAPPESPPST